MVADNDGDRRMLFHALPPGCLRQNAEGPELDFCGCWIRLTK